jgi:arabinoxylan arabinofuranohydrolase
MHNGAPMTIRRGIASTLLFALLGINTRAYADYPIVSHRYLADPGSMVYDGRIYLYNSNDDDNALEGGYTMHSVVCVSTSDLKNWTDHGIVFSVPDNASWAANSWAPQPISRDGTIYLYFGNSGSGIGVASSKDPTGGFKDAKGSYLINSSTPGASGAGWLFDPGALIDGDGQAYLSFGGNGETNARIIKLGNDLSSVSGTAAQLAPKAFYEASFLFKRNSIYYFAYSTDSSAQMRIDYLKSSSPMSGYTYGGIIGDQPPENGNNNHASEFEFKGQWYHAYHNRVVAKKAGIADTYKRNIAIEVLDFNEDGSIKKVTYTTDGVPQVGTLNPYVRVEGETTNAQSGIETEVCTEGGMDVTNINNGDWIRVRGVDFGTAGAESFTARVASEGSGGNIELHSGTQTGTLIGTCKISGTGGAQKWADVTCPVAGATGVKDLYLAFTGSGTAALFNLNYWQFTPTGGITAGAGGTAGSGNASSGGSVSAAGGPSNGGTFSGGGRANVGGDSPNGGISAAGRSPRSGGGGTPSSSGPLNAGGTNATGGFFSTKGSPNGGSGNLVTQSSGSGGAGSGATGNTPTGGSAAATSARSNSTTLSGGGNAVATATQSGLGGGKGSGTASASKGGSTTTASSANPSAASGDSGCSCRVTAGDGSPRSVWGMALLGGALLAFTRQRSRLLIRRDRIGRTASRTKGL